MNELVQWLREFNRPEIVWLAAGLILMISEFFMPGFIVLFFGFGAVLTGAACLIFDISINIQMLIFVIFSLISLITMRKLLRNIFIGDKKDSASGLDEEGEYKGKKAVVVSRIEAGGEGKIEFEGSNWKATCGKTIEAGQRVVIVRRDNLTLIVKEE